MTATATPTYTTLSHDIDTALDRLRTAYTEGITRDLDWREAQLDGILSFLDTHGEALLDAMQSDLGRPRTEGWGADVGAAIGETAYLKKRFRKWAKPRRTPVSLIAQPGSARIIPEPLGVALVIAPWNYPVNLVLEPMAAAYAAGNAVVLSPSELAPATSALICRELPHFLDPAGFDVFPGGPDVSSSLLERRFDHVFFTGSTQVGQIVMEAAAKHLTPVILELGGKSPTIVADDADIEVAGKRIAWGKGLNAGQTCIAPDYVLVSERRRDELIDGIAEAWREFYGDDSSTSPDFGRIVNEYHHDRLVGLLDRQAIAVGGGHDRTERFIEPTIVVDPDLDSPVMTDEIFGPILPVITVADIHEAVRFVNDRPKPLALYVFSGDRDLADDVLARTSSGGACINHTLFHYAPHELPFGGVGASGMGRYHGKAGFDGFSNLKGVLRKPVKGETNVGYPPYTKLKDKLIRRLG
ncbi:MAG: aldehyde dehydrogenase family protein [Acidimicrobiales bacterium]|nr:aldehyde dehydrogenase family protein [Acidimicrobiales bacterium]